MNASGIVGGLFNFCIFYFFHLLNFFSKSGYMPCEQVLLWWTWNGYNILSTRKKKPTTEHTNGFPYYLIYTEWRGDIFTVILKLINIQLPFKIIINIALGKCLETFLGKTANVAFGRDWIYHTRSITNASFNLFRFHYGGSFKKLRKIYILNMWKVNIAFNLKQSKGLKAQLSTLYIPLEVFLDKVICAEVAFLGFR